VNHLRFVIAVVSVMPLLKGSKQGGMCVVLILRNISKRDFLLQAHRKIAIKRIPQNKGGGALGGGGSHQ